MSLFLWWCFHICFLSFSFCSGPARLPQPHPVRSPQPPPRSQHGRWAVLRWWPRSSFANLKRTSLPNTKKGKKKERLKGKKQFLGQKTETKSKGVRIDEIWVCFLCKSRNLLFAIYIVKPRIPCLRMACLKVTWAPPPGNSTNEIWKLSTSLIVRFNYVCFVFFHLFFFNTKSNDW